MTDKSIYLDYCNVLYQRLRNEVNGRIKYELYADINTVIIKIVFKDFEFSYAIKDLSDHIYSCDTDMLIEDIKRTYRATILSAFFKRKGENYGIHEN